MIHGKPYIYMQSKKKENYWPYCWPERKCRIQTTDAGMCNKKKKLEKSEISLSGPEMKSKRCRRQTSKPAQKKSQEDERALLTMVRNYL